MKPLNILIVCWDFPPVRAIGGRRWAKFAKVLALQGHRVNVLTNRISTSAAAQKTWISNDELAGMHVTRIKKHLLVRALNNYAVPGAFFFVRAAALLLKLWQKGTIFDRAIGIERRFLSHASELIRRQEVSVVFVTGAPFNLLYYASRLRKQFPNLVLVGDYRDPWLTALNYGMASLSPRRKAEEQRKQNEVLNAFTYITAPNKFLLEEIHNSYTGLDAPKAKFVELPHAFDTADVVKTLSTHKDPKKLKLLYAGTLYIGLEKHIDCLNESVSHLKKMGWTTANVEIRLFASGASKKELFPGNQDIVNVYPPVDDKIFQEVAGADYVLIFLAEHNKNYVTSKFLEFLPYRKPYIYFGPEGFVSEKIRNEGLGFCITHPNDLFAVLNNGANKVLPASTDIQKYSFDVVISEFLESIHLNS